MYVKMLNYVKLFGAGAKVGLLGGLYCGLLSALILFINNPMFMDNLFSGVLLFVILPTLLGSFLGAVVVIPVSFLSVNNNYHLIKKRVILAGLILPVLLFCALLGMIFFILIKNNFINVSDAFCFSLFFVIAALPLFWGFSIIESTKRGLRRFVASSKLILLFVLIVIGISGIVFVSQRYAYSTKVHKEKKKIIVIAIGGATWKVINPLLKENDLPCIAQLMRDGSFGSLESPESMASAVTWASGATGGLPEKHGISPHGYSSNSYRMKTFWEVAEQNGMSVGVFEYLANWPPKKTNGYVIPGWDAFNTETFPSKFSFVKRLERMEKQRNRRKVWDYFQIFVLAVRNGLRLETIMNSAVYIYQEKFCNLKYLDRIYRAHLSKLALTSDIFTYLYKKCPYDVSVYYNGATDGMGHFYWRFFEPEKFNNVQEHELEKYGHVLPLVYRKTDETIGKILQVVDESTTVVIFSNHGLKASPNHALDRTYYLLNSQKLLELLDLSREISVTRTDRIEHLKVNSGKTKDLHTLVERLRELEAERNHQKLIEFVRIDQDLKVATVTVNPEAMTDEDVSVRFRNTLMKIKDLVERAEIPFSAVHDRDGIILIKGPNIKKGYEIQDAKLVDVTPTILTILGLPLNSDMDGRVLTQLFDYLPPSRL